MKMKNIFAVLLLAAVSQSVLAIEVVIEQADNFLRYTHIKPLWTGGPQQFFMLGEPQADREQTKNAQATCTVKTGIHQLRGLLVQDGKKTYRFDFEKFKLRGTGLVMIQVGYGINSKGFSASLPANKVSISGYTDMVFKKATSFNAEVVGTEVEAADAKWKLVGK